MRSLKQDHRAMQNRLLRHLPPDERHHVLRWCAPVDLSDKRV